MMFGAWGNPDHDDSIRIIHAALDGGINFVDTADVYSAGESEEIVGKALQGRRDDVVLATKAHGPMGEDPNMRGNSRRWIVREVENSLRRLQTDYIDLYQMHRPDPDTDIDETLSALSDLVRSGKVRAVGSSTFPAEQIVEAQWVAERRGHERFRCEQPPYSILVRGIEAAVLPDVPEVRHGRDRLEPAGRRLADRPVPQGRRHRHDHRPRAAAAAPVRPVAARQPGQARGRRGAHQDRRRRGLLADPPGAGLRDRAPGRDLGDHRPAHHGPAHRPAGGRRASRWTTTCSTGSTRSSRRG